MEHFTDKLSQLPKHESYSHAAKKPQLTCKALSEVIFDYEFTRLFKRLESQSIVSFHLHFLQSKVARVFLNLFYYWQTWFIGNSISLTELLSDAQQRIYCSSTISFDVDGICYPKDEEQHCLLFV